MKLLLGVLALALIAQIPAIGSQTGNRRPVLPDADQSEQLTLSGGVPRGYMILGDSPSPPPGYSYLGLTVSADHPPTWTSRSSMLSSRTDLAAAAANGKVYAIGGFNGGTLASVEEYDPETDTWTSRSPMSMARKALAAVALNGRVYAIGGDSNGSFLALLEEYDPATNTWTTRAPMHSARGHLGVATINGKLYAIGGYNGAALATVEKYDPQTDSWTTLAPLPTPRSEHTVAAVDGKIYAIGGDDGFQSLRTFEEYDPDTDTWIRKGAFSWAYDQGAAVVNEKIYVMGGVYTYTAEYDPQNGTAWRAKDPMPADRSALAAAAVDGKIYAIGGQDGLVPVSTVEQFDPGRVLYVHRKN